MTTIQWFILITTMISPKRIVLTLNCPYLGVPLQSKCSDWFPMSLTFHHYCPYNECPYVENLLYCLSLTRTGDNLQPESLRSLKKASEDSGSVAGSSDSPLATGATPQELHHASLKVASWTSQSGKAAVASQVALSRCMHMAILPKSSARCDSCCDGLNSASMNDGTCRYCSQSSAAYAHLHTPQVLQLKCQNWAVLHQIAFRHKSQHTQR